MIGMNSSIEPKSVAERKRTARLLLLLLEKALKERNEFAIHLAETITLWNTSIPGWNTDKYADSSADLR